MNKKTNSWSSWFNNERVSDDFMTEREQDTFPAERIEEFEPSISLVNSESTSKSEKP
jgi:hypothetical protein